MALNGRVLSRVLKLERLGARLRVKAASASGTPCAVCGHYEGMRVKYVLRWEGDEDPGEEFCSGCGRRRVHYIKFDTDG